MHDKPDEKKSFMATRQYRTKEISINYSSTRTDGGNKGLPLKRDKCRICRQRKQ